jgi:hypothetical protein
MVEVPAERPVTIPEPEPIVATVSVELYHVPPVGEPASAVVEPSHNVNVPVIVCPLALKVAHNKRSTIKRFRCFMEFVCG